MKPITRFKTWWNLHFGPPRPLELARSELLKSKKALLENLTHAEYYDAMVKFERQRIKRLTDYIQRGME